MMARASLVLLLLFFVIQVYAQPFSFLRKLSATSQEGSWLWGWVWGAESSVSVVDRSPPLTFRSRPASFGRELKEPLLGYVIPLSSFTTPCPGNDTSLVDRHLNLGCPKLCIYGPHQPDPSESWIALLQRGQCSFVDKVRESQRLGAKAVVIGGQDPDISGQPDMLVNMYSTGDASDVEIASTYITWSDYKELSSLIRSSTTSHAGLQTLSLLITTQYSAWEWYSPILTFIVILILPSCLTFVTLLIHRIRMARAAQRDRAPENVVKGFPWRVWNGTAWEKHEGTTTHGAHSIGAHDTDLESGPSDHSASSPSTSHEALNHAPIPWCESQAECAICLSEFVKGDCVRELPCHHIFHLEEVDSWLINRKKLCPVCKADVTRPWHLSQANKPHAAPANEQGSDSDAVSSSVITPPITELTPLLRDRSGSTGS
ncbi:uncharacterized protein F5147DRAFT_709712 [Suillus discolor]|uniref:RING-type E3 ubiquitin transferase n=1 Tax=Suillus discolor TaxID=1912936 RepID=A0A9P7F044_9AGAM|nr:uncharacterized protein F5147DRAFT_709712 [Suillus discolor]KAG2101077.1 hypothetical protein F5147DRAFT_709712 [Suillus discolor]